MKGSPVRSFGGALPDPNRPFETGEVLEKRFRIVGTVARGGMGTVYEAWDKMLDKRIALKCAKPGFSGHLPPEVRSATEITHPNVCRVFEIHSSRYQGVDVDFLTMEFLDGQTLKERLKAGPLSKIEARSIARQICDGLAEAHRRGVIHGDLKANNVILVPSGNGGVRAVITDFGLASSRPSDPESIGTAGGTPAYMAPELWEGARHSIASDIYALGVLLCELAYGHRPVRPGGEHAGGGEHSLLATRSKTDRVLARCLEYDPADRYGGVDDVIQDFAPANKNALMAGVVGVVVAAALWAGGTMGAWYRDDGGLPIAVVPFANEGLPPESDYLCEGLAENLIHHLAQFPGMKVIARTSSFQFASRQDDLKRMADRLGVALVVTGRVRAIGGDHFRVSTELTNPVKGTQLWGAQYDLSLSDLSGIEEQIAQRIAEQVGAKLRVDAATRSGRRAGIDPQAYELLLRGQYQRRLYSPESRQKAIGYFEQALAIDPQFALANAELANIYRLLEGGGILDSADAMPKAEAAALRAIAADPNLAEAHVVLGDIAKDRWDFAAAETEYRTALDLNPSLPDAHMGYAILLSVIGKSQLALSEAERMVALDPVGIQTALHSAAVHYNLRRYDAALKELKRAETMDPRAPSPWAWMGIVYGGSGRYREAVQAYEEAIQRKDTTAATRCFYIYSLARSGERQRALELLDELATTSEFVPLTALAVAHSGLDQQDRAMELLQQAYTRPDPILQYLKVESHFDSLRNRKEYLELAEKLRLP